MSNVPEGNQRAGPDATATPSSAAPRRFIRSARGATVMGLLLMALVLAFGALSGTAAAEVEEETGGEVEESQTGGEVEESRAETGSDASGDEEADASGDEDADSSGDEEVAASSAGSSSYQRGIDAVRDARTNHSDFSASTDRTPAVARTLSSARDALVDVQRTIRTDTAAPAPDPVADTEPAVTSTSVTAGVTEITAKVTGLVDMADVSNDSDLETTNSLSSTSLEAEVSPAVEPAPDSITQCNAPDVVQQDGREVNCSVTIDNFTTVEGVKTSVVTTTKCEGPRNAVLCETPVTTTYVGHVTTVNQCNGILNAGGSEVECEVTITNHVPLPTETVPLTVNQCQGTGGGGGTIVTCVPLSATSGAMVDQCNGSATGGGGFVICIVDGEETAIPLTIDQCNGSATGGGSFVICTVTVENVPIEPGEGGTPPGDTPPGDTPPGDTPPDDGGDGGDGDGDDGEGGDDGDDGDDGLFTRGPSTRTPLALTPASPVSPMSPMSTTPTAAGPASVPAAGSGVTGTSASQAPSLPATGADIGTMAAMGLIALMLGGLLLLISRSARKVTANH